jgi:hypothetical protein
MAGRHEAARIPTEELGQGVATLPLLQGSPGMGQQGETFTPNGERTVRQGRGMKFDEKGSVTTNDVALVVRVIRTVADAIKELGQVPSGELYSQLMSFMTLEEYNMVIGFLTKAKLITYQNHLITWVG